MKRFARCGILVLTALASLATGQALAGSTCLNNVVPSFYSSAGVLKNFTAGVYGGSPPSNTGGGRYCVEMQATTGLRLSLTSAVPCPGGDADAVYFPATGHVTFSSDIAVGAIPYSVVELQYGSDGLFGVTAAKANGADGIWKGTTNGLTALGWSLTDGSFSYFIYVSPTDPFPIGYISGTGWAYGGTAGSTSASSYSFVDGSRNPTSICTQYLNRNAMTGTIDVPSKGGTFSFDAMYDSNYQTPATLASITGQYDVTVGFNNPLTGRITKADIDVLGKVAIAMQTGCQLAGAVTPQDFFSIYALFLESIGTACPNPGQKFNGTVYLDLTGKLQAGATNEDGSAALVVVGDKIKF